MQGRKFFRTIVLAMVMMFIFCGSEFVAAPKTLPKNVRCTATKHLGSTKKVLVSKATCRKKATYKNVCTKCGKQVGKTYTEGKFGDHTYIWKINWTNGPIRPVGKAAVCRYKYCTTCKHIYYGQTNGVADKSFQHDFKKTVTKIAYGEYTHQGKKATKREDYNLKCKRAGCSYNHIFSNFWAKKNGKWLIQWSE